MKPPETKKKTSSKGRGKTGQNRTQKEGSGTGDKRKRTRQKAFIAVLKGQSIFNIRRACADSGVSRSQYYEWIKEPKFHDEIDEIFEGRKDDFEEHLQKESRSGDSRATTFFLERKARDRGYGKESDNSKLKDILKKARDGELSVLQAAYEVNMLGLPLPEVLKLQLNKPDPPPPPPDERPPLSNDELEQKYLATIAAAEAQSGEWLDGRREEVRQIKEQEKHRDQFFPEGRDE